MFNPTYDFRYLKTHLRIDHILAAYGLDSKLRRQGHLLSGPCPLHGGDNPTAFRVHLQRGVWHCFTSCGGGDIVDLIRHIEHCSFAQAARILRRLIDSPRVSVPPHLSHPFIFSPFVYSIPLTPKVAFLQEVKKISVSTALRYEAGTASKSSLLRSSVAVRLHDLSGMPLGYCGRRLDPEAIVRWGKWRFPQNFPKSDILYNAHRALPFRNQGIIVVECPWAVMRLGQAGINNSVALLGSSISPTQIGWLSHAPMVLLLLDGDNAGQKAAPIIARALHTQTRVFIHHLPNGLEPEDLSDEKLISVANKYFHLS